jgi:hypothetical protein
MGIFALNPAHPKPRAIKTMGKIQKDLKFPATIFPPFSIFGKSQMLYKPPEKKKPLTPFPRRFGRKMKPQPNSLVSKFTLELILLRGFLYYKRYKTQKKRFYSLSRKEKRQLC